ncbi:MAG: MBL fold metallo-hydrolase [Acidimicrobiales bacterium]
MIEGLTLWLAATNSWIVAPAGPGGECVIIDAPPDPEAILARLTEHDLKLVAILATHGHVDHVGGIGAVLKGTAAAAVPRVHLHPLDRHLMNHPHSAGTLGRLLDLDALPFPAPEMVYDLDHGQRVSGAGMTFTALHTPGHTQGSVCFLLDSLGDPPILFSGDHLFAGSVGRTDLEGGDHQMLLDSMAAHILPLSDEVLVLPGHGPTTTVGHERATNPFLAGLGPAVA